MNFLPGVLSMAFNKEYIVANDELIIYLTFLGLLVWIVNASKNIVTKLFNDVQDFEKNILQSNSISSQKILNETTTTAEIFASAADFDITLPEPSNEFIEITQQ
jgi:Trk-type K+ transport system membrane component